jgi:hypothetical protein
MVDVRRSPEPPTAADGKTSEEKSMAALAEVPLIGAE